VHFHKFLEKAKQHEKSDWHIESFIWSKDFMDMMKSNSGIDQILDSHYRNKITENINKLTYLFVEIMTILLYLIIY
jgi:hypothetical protein